MKARRIIAMLIVVCLCIPAFAACTDNSTAFTPGGESANVDTQFPAANYNGEDFVFLTMTTNTGSSAGGEYYCGNWVAAEELTGTATNDAVYYRNLACRDKYNVNIVEKRLENSQGAVEQLNEFYRAGDVSFDVIYSWANRLGVGVVDNLYHDFRDLDAQGYIKLSESYWNPTALEDLTIGGKTYLAVNDITMSKLSWSSCLFYNPSIVTDLGLEDPQDLVEANNWTIDKFISLVESVSIEKDGDGQFTKEDQYGMITDGSGDGLLRGCGVTGTTKDADGNYELAIGETKVIDLITKIRNTFDNKKYVFTTEDIKANADFGGLDEWQYTRSYFATGHSLFLSGTPEITRELKDMENGYGVVPLPKCDTNQAEYVSGIDSCGGVFALPNSIRTDADRGSASYQRTGYILDYLAYKSSAEGSTNVVSAYYDTTIKSQRSTIERNKDMLDIVRNTGRYEWTDIFHVGEKKDFDSNGVMGILGQMYNKKGSIKSTYDRQKERLQKAVDETYSKIEALAVN